MTLKVFVFAQMLFSAIEHIFIYFDKKTNACSEKYLNIVVSDKVCIAFHSCKHWNMCKCTQQ
jgi:hypothetical protein